MSHFSFRLQPLMKLREAQRDRCREDLAHAYRADQILQERQEAVRQEIEETKRVARSKSEPGRVEVESLLNVHRYELILSSQLQQLAAQRQKVAVELERRRLALVEADRGLRMLEKLRERHACEFQQAEEKVQIRQMDEIALQRRRALRKGDNA